MNITREVKPGVRRAGLIIFRRKDGRTPVEWLLLQSSYPPHRWTPPRAEGMVEDGEDELTAAIREVREETGLLPHNLWLFEDLKRENPEGVDFTGSYWLTMLIDHDKTEYSWSELKQARKLSSYTNISKMMRHYQAIVDCFWY